MSRTHHHSDKRLAPQPRRVRDEDLELHPELVPVDERLADLHTRTLLNALIRAHRDQLVATARQHLGKRRQDAEDVVQDLCVEVLEGDVTLSFDAAEALDDLLRELVERCKAGAR